MSFNANRSSFPPSIDATRVSPWTAKRYGALIIAVKSAMVRKMAGIARKIAIINAAIWELILYADQAIVDTV
jgi:hypothetical protein